MAEHLKGSLVAGGAPFSVLSPILARELLAEIPGQLMQYMQMQNIIPNPPTMVVQQQAQPQIPHAVPVSAQGVVVDVMEQKYDNPTTTVAI